jgi:hypothetical protein
MIANRKPYVLQADEEDNEDWEILRDDDGDIADNINESSNNKDADGDNAPIVIPELEMLEEFDDYIANTYVPAMKNDEANVVINYLGNLNTTQEYLCCPHCQAKHFCGERLVLHSKNLFGVCCGKGMFVPEKPSNTPDFLKSLFLGKSEYSSFFFRSPLEYNTACSFAATCVNEGERLRGRGPPAFRACGEVKYTVAHPLAHMRDGDMSFKEGLSNFYIYDASEEMSDVADKRMKLVGSKSLNKNLMMKLSKTLAETNPWIKEFKTMREKENQWREENTPMCKQNLYFKDPTYVQKVKRGGKPNHEINVPNRNEVSLVYVGN